MAAAAPRISVLVAQRAPVAAVLRRGPSAWWHVLRWDLETLEVEPGAWLHGTLYPRRSDLSPDGRLLAAVVLSSRPSPWDAYAAVSKLPWLTALAAWHVGSTWTSGLAFAPDGVLLHPFGADAEPTWGRYPGRMRPFPPQAVAGSPFVERDVGNELRRGWTPTAGPDGDPLTLERPRPGHHGDVLRLTHRGHAVGEPLIEGVVISYTFRSAGHDMPLSDVQWADWDRGGRLLVATRSGSIAVREPEVGGWRESWSHDLAGAQPDPRPAPGWAAGW